MLRKGRFMYDTRFFMSTYNLKQEILKGNHAGAAAEDIYDKLNACLAAQPFVFNIETTSHCNMRCMMCQRTTDMARKPQHMDMRTFTRLADQITPMAGADKTQWRAFVEGHLLQGTETTENTFYFDIVSQSVTLHGFGEPLLDPLLPQRVALLSQRSIPSYFSCNPCNVQLDCIAELFDAGLGYIKFAMDSLDDAEARKIRGGPADFTRSYENVLAVLDLKKRKGASTVIVMTMLDFSGDFGQSSQAARFLQLWRDKDVYAYVKSVDNKWLLQRKGEQDKARGENKSHYCAQYCEYPWTSLTVLADGSVVPCTQDINGSHVFGNVNDASLAEIWRSPRLQQFRMQHIRGDFPDDFMCHARCDLPLLAYHIGTKPWA